ERQRWRSYAPGCEPRERVAGGDGGVGPRAQDGDALEAPRGLLERPAPLVAARDREERACADGEVVLLREPEEERGRRRAGAAQGRGAHGAEEGALPERRGPFAGAL